MPSDTCERHLAVADDVSTLKSRVGELDKSIQTLWSKYDALERDARASIVRVPELTINISDILKDTKIRALEEEGYRQTIRQHTKDIETLGCDLDKVGELSARKTETASKEEVLNLFRWVKYGWLATIFAVLALVANIVLMIWRK